jgi:hypothetical protein
MSGNECINQEKLRTNKHSVHCNTNYPLETLSTQILVQLHFTRWKNAPIYQENVSINMYIFAVNYQF